MLAYTMEADLDVGAEFIIVEARESGLGIGIYDKHGECQEEMINNIIDNVSDARKLIWEAPLSGSKRCFSANLDLMYIWEISNPPKCFPLKRCAGVFVKIRLNSG